ncbi:MAG: FHA domain-containing protein [Polyangiales bacterium]
MRAERLQRFVEEHRAQGAEAFRRRHDDPVLVREDSGPDWEDDDRSYQTGFMAREELRRTTRQSLRAILGDQDEDDAPSDPAQPAVNEVYVVAKREGAPFQDRIGIGRAPNTDVCIPLSRISKYHAFVTREDGRYYITDAGSKNGTTVAGETIEAKQPANIPDGARVHIGPYPFRFYTPDGFERLVASRAAQR